MRRFKEGPKIVISFSIKEARDQLMNNGIVYTFRWNLRKRTGKDWAQVKRGTKKIADVHIEEIGLVKTIPDLKPYVGESGFDSLMTWRKAIMSTYKPSLMLPGGYLYKVTLVSKEHCCFWNKDKGCDYPDPEPDCVPGKCWSYWGDNWSYYYTAAESQQLRSKTQ